MANKEQLAILKQRVEVWNQWRAWNADVNIDLREANLRGAHLNEANLVRADLSGADLVRADLYKSNLSGANLCEANLRFASISGVDLSGANLRETDLTRAKLLGTNLRDTYLYWADLSNTLMPKADLSRARLGWAHFSRAMLNMADFSQAELAFTVFADNDLSTVKGLESIVHRHPSEISVSTIYKSKGNIPEVFLRGCGVPENLITFMRSLTGKAFDFYSCFISHSAKDKPFCERLHNDLQANCVRTWYFPEDAKWGETVWGEIDRGIKIYDKLVVVCSQNSLQSEPVIREIDRSLQREAREHKNILFPITLDHYVFDTWEHELKADLLRKVIGEFCRWDSDAAAYGKAFERLLRNLQAG